MNKTLFENISDPFLDDKRVTSKLEQDYEKHKNLVVAVDFDSTIHPFRNPGCTFPKLIQLLRDCKEKGFYIIIFTASHKERHTYIKEYCRENNIPFDTINEDIVYFKQYPQLDWTNSKIYYNILLDDKAGLSASYKILRNFVDNLT